MTPAARLLAWYDRKGRDLPWRQTRDPYRILVSELMLQQTQVARVILFYDRWLKQFPDWRALADATNADVIHAWAGLGYNRRALALRDIAKQVVANGVPKTEQDWLALKGIGPYTAAALAAFSGHERTFPIDTTIRRVADRLLLRVLFPDPALDDRLRKKAETFLPQRGRFYDVPQALFDLATAICKKEPLCASCPMREDCPSAKAFLSGRIKTPKAMIKKAVESKHRDKPYPDRIYRARILKLVREHKNGVPILRLGKEIDPTFNVEEDQAWIERMVDRLATDQLLKRKGKTVSL